MKLINPSITRYTLRTEHCERNIKLATLDSVATRKNNYFGWKSAYDFFFHKTKTIKWPWWWQTNNASFGCRTRFLSSLDGFLGVAYPSSFNFRSSLAGPSSDTVGREGVVVVIIIMKITSRKDKVGV